MVTPITNHYEHVLSHVIPHGKQVKHIYIYMYIYIPIDIYIYRHIYIYMLLFLPMPRTCCHHPLVAGLSLFESDEDGRRSVVSRSPGEVSPELIA